jgi:hypothetical protein
MTLIERAAADVRPSRCAVCLLPSDLRAEVDDILRKRDISKAAMIRTLKGEGHQVTRNKIDYHEREWHHRQAGRAVKEKRAR